MLRKENLLREVTEKLTWVQMNIKQRNAIGRIDDNLGMEDLYCGILNIIFADYKLQNANHVKMNCPAIDLVDVENGLAVQVTSTCSRDKITHTLEEFFSHGLEQTFSRLIIMQIGNRKTYSKVFEIKNGFQFDPTEDIWDNKKLLQKISELSISRLKQLNEYLDEQINVPSNTAQKLNLPIGKSLGANAFVGRNRELAQISQAVSEGINPIILTGLGGIGKTELVRRFGQTYHDGQIYFVIFQNSFKDTVSLGIAKGIDGLPEQISSADAYRIAMDCLSACSPKDILIIDNADKDTGSFADLEDDTFSSLCAMDVRIIITTRFDVFGAIDVGQLEHDELRKIFDNHKASTSIDEKDMLIRAVDSHTMTVDLMARMMVGTWKPVTVQELLSALKKQDLTQFDREIGSDYNREQKQRRIYDHLKILFDLSGIPDAAKHVLRCATLLPDDGMDSRSFGEALPDDLHQSLDELIRHGWLTCRELLTIHPVIRLVCREELKSDESILSEFLNAIAKQYQEEEYNAPKYLQWAKLFSLAANEHPDKEGNYLLMASFFWKKIGRLREALEYGHQLLSLKEQQFGPDHPELCTAYNNLGIIYGDYGNHTESLKYLQKALSLQQQLKNPDLLLLATYYDNVGYAYGNLGNYQNALIHAQHALDIRKATLPPNHIDLAYSYNNVGSAYHELGDYTRALHFWLQSVAIREQILPPNHPDLATTYDNVGGTYDKLGDHKKALSFKMRALNIRKVILPEDHPEIAISYNNIGVLHLKCGDCEKARTYIINALEIRKKIFPENHPSIAGAYNDLGCVYDIMGKRKMALSHKMKALKVRETALPHAHPDVIWSYNNVAHTLTTMARFEEATKYAHRATELANEAFPIGHPIRKTLQDSLHMIEYLNSENKLGHDISRYMDELRKSL